MGSVHPKLVLQEAQDLESRGDLKSASIKYASLIQVFVRRGKYAEAIELCDKAFALSPDSTRLQLTRAVILSQLKRESEAIAEVEKFAQSALRQNRVVRYLELSQEQLNSKPRLLKRFLEKILEVERTKAELFFAFAEVLQRLGEVDRAIEIVLAGLRIGNNLDVGHELLRTLLDERGRPKDLMAFDKLVDGSWSLERVYQILLVENKSSMEPKSETNSPFMRAVPEELSGKDEESIKDLIQELEEKLGERPHGIETLSGLVKEFKEKAQSVLEGDDLGQIDLSLAFREMGLNQEAKDFLFRIREDSEHYVQAQMLLGTIELDSGSLVSALDIFQNILRRGGLEKNILLESLYSTARIYLELGEVMKAEAHINKLTQLDSHYRESARLKQMIKKKCNALSKK